MSTISSRLPGFVALANSFIDNGLSRTSLKEKQVRTPEKASERKGRFSATPITGWKLGPRANFAYFRSVADGSSPEIFWNPSSTIILLLVPGPEPESRIQSDLYFSSLRIALRLSGPARPIEIISLIDSYKGRARSMALTTVLHSSVA